MKKRIEKYIDEHQMDVGLALGFASSMLGMFIAARIYENLGYKMVKPDGRTPTGETLVRQLFGQRWVIEYTPE
jgi:hypothetical protein